MIKRLLSAALFCLFPTITMAGTVLIKDDPGGRVNEYNSRWQRYRDSQDTVMIDGACTSACARFMTLPKVCATPQAYFYLHGITYGTGEVDRAAGVADSRQWESPRAFSIQQRYDVFAFGFVQAPRKIVEAKAPGIEVVHFYIPAMKTYQKFLKVKATLLIPACKPTTTVAVTLNPIGF
jgi:hypothetical protein